MPKKVYPRVGGANQRRVVHHFRGEGLSPRGRGKRLQSTLPTTPLRSIPAWAGQTPPRVGPAPGSTVYPRVGGANASALSSISMRPGLSPRGRGKLSRYDFLAVGTGSIPAWAGQTAASVAWMATCKVYPRVGGANQGRPPSSRDRRGLSPRGRGKPPGSPETPGWGRSIPAWAGQTALPGAAMIYKAVYPRVGGANPAEFFPKLRQGGLSPRGRGKP